VSRLFVPPLALTFRYFRGTYIVKRRSFITAGRVTSEIDVKISNRIIELFSEGLYSSPHKALEELVANAFDAGAVNVHVLLDPDLSADDATIAVIDDGEGMDETGFEQHWIIGSSNKRDKDFAAPRGRRQIGKFGIGKLATYVLADRLTHISKRGRQYYAATMDYAKIPNNDGKGVFVQDPIQLKLRELTSLEAQEVLRPWIKGDKPGYEALKLFGRGASKGWTVAILSSLKDMATEIKRGQLAWVLATAMPLRDDFNLFLNGNVVTSSKLRTKRVGRWVLGQDLLNLPKPAPDEGESTEVQSEDLKSPRRFGLTYQSLGRISGYIEIYEDPIDEGKSEEIERSNGFFVYVRDRLVNVDDPGFGIERNKLRHGTFSRFRMVLYIDALDAELRSSRETLRAGALFNIARNIAIGGFNFARTKLEDAERKELTGRQVAARVESSPAGLTRRPLSGLVASAFSGKYSPRYVAVPRDLSPEQQQEFVEALRTEQEGGPPLVQDTLLATELSQDQPIAIFDTRTGILQINTRHPFVTYFLDEFEDKKQSLPLELIAMSEILLEAQLHQLGILPDQIYEALDRRDQLLRHLVRSTGKRNARMVAQALIDAASDQNKLEEELVASFDSMGFEAVRMGGKKRADGRAVAYLSATPGGGRQGYAVSLEAKSKEKPGTKVTAKSVGVSTIARHRRDNNCDYAVVVGPDFPTTQGDTAALAEEIVDDRHKNPGKTITLIRINDLARLVRLVPLKRIGHDRLRDLFIECNLPEDVKRWIDKIEAEEQPRAPYLQILNIVQGEQKKSDEELVEFGIVRSKLRDDYGIQMKQVDLISSCRALARFVPQWVTVNESSIEISMRPDKILAAVQAVIGEYPEQERRKGEFST